MTNALSEETNFAITAAREAAQIVLAVYGRNFDVDHKAQNEPVTQADRRANAFLVQRFSHAYPNDGIVAEESLPTDDALAEQVSAERVWFIDPLDGTKEFIARNGEFSVMIGLAVRGRPVLGVVAMPVSGVVAVGCVGHGAWLITPDGTSTPLRVSDQSRLDACTVIISRSHMSEPLRRVVEAVHPASQVRCGSVGVKATRIAERQADVYVNVHQPGGAKLWDGCAPEAIVVAAGGRTTDLSGSLIDYATTTLELVGGYVATNGPLHDGVIEAAKRALGDLSSP